MQILILFALLPGTIGQFFFLTKAVPVKKPWLFTALNVICCYILWAINNYVLPTASVPLDIAQYLFNLAAILIFTTSAYWISAVVCFLCIVLTQYVVVALMLVLLVPIFNACGITTEILTSPDSYWYALMSLICSLLVVPCMALIAKLGKRWSKPIPISLWLLANLCVPISQVILLNICIRLISAPDDFSGYTAMLIFGAAFCLAADIVMIFGISRHLRNRHIQDHLTLLQEQLELQQSYYLQMQQNIQQINHIRHDLSNQLQTAYQLIENGHTDYARKQLDDLQQNLSEKAGPTYCANIMADAVLKDKARICREREIGLNVALEIPSDLTIRSSHLCSILSNLLDNSIKGAQQSGVTHPCIDLRASIRANHLSIHCSNPALAPKPAASRDPMRRHGLGLDILSYLAQLYHGNLQTQFHDGIFQTVVILEIPE